MTVPIFSSIKSIQKQYYTGEEPVSVVCADLHEYICKYNRSLGSSYKLICEMVGSILAREWQIVTPDFALVKILSKHWTCTRTVNLAAPAFGSKVIRSAVDVTLNSDKLILGNTRLRRQIAEIALFDLWVANEDRNWNNANLLYDVEREELVAIDHGCIFNTATFDYCLSLLTENESILWSDLFRNIFRDYVNEDVGQLLNRLKEKFYGVVDKKDQLISEIVDNIPESWGLGSAVLKTKLDELFVREWVDRCWECFVEYFNGCVNGSDAI